MSRLNSYICINIDRSIDIDIDYMVDIDIDYRLDPLSTAPSRGQISSIQIFCRYLLLCISIGSKIPPRKDFRSHTGYLALKQTECLSSKKKEAGAKYVITERFLSSNSVESVLNKNIVASINRLRIIESVVQLITIPGTASL